MQSANEFVQPSDIVAALPRLVGIGELCSLLGVKRTKAYDLINSRCVRSCRLGSRRLIDLASILDLRESLLSGEFVDTPGNDGKDAVYGR